MRLFSNLNVQSNRLWNLPSAPKYGSEAPSIEYVLSLFGVSTTFAPVVAASTVDVPLTGSGTTLTIDGVEIVAGDRVLLAGQNNLPADANNGIRVLQVNTVANTYSLVRSDDANNSLEFVAGASVLALGGITNGKKKWTLVTETPLSLGATAIEFVAEPAFTGNGAQKAVVEYTGDGVATSFTVAHDLGTEDYTVQLWHGGELFIADVVKIVDNVTSEVDLNNFTVNLGIPIPNGEIVRVVVIG